MERKADYPVTHHYTQSSGERKRNTGSSVAAVTDTEQGILPPPPGQHTLTPAIREAPHPSPLPSQQQSFTVPDYPRMYRNLDSGSVDILELVPDYYYEEEKK